ncbi:flavin reductase family protein, partial [Acinetobacter baumannii]|nr:flavin reductase family protein [Acinetobacter baumannii]
LYAGGRSYADAPDKNDTIPFFYQPEFDLPLVAGCAGWLVCKVMPYPDIQQQHNLFMGDIVAAWSDDRVFRNGHWIFDDAPDELRT